MTRDNEGEREARKEASGTQAPRGARGEGASPRKVEVAGEGRGRWEPGRPEHSDLERNEGLGRGSDR